VISRQIDDMRLLLNPGETGRGFLVPTRGGRKSGIRGFLGVFWPGVGQIRPI
jgi:hypothetical protein